MLEDQATSRESNGQVKEVRTAKDSDVQLMPTSELSPSSHQNQAQDGAEQSDTEIASGSEVPVSSVGADLLGQLKMAPSKVAGDIIISGSAAVFELTQAVYARFTEAGYAGKMTLSNSGSSVGFKLLCEWHMSDIALASRPIRDKETAACVENGRVPLELHAGIDALVVAVNPGNDFVSDLTLQELATVLSAEKWSDVNPIWPDEAIVRFVLAEETAKFEFLPRKVLGGDLERALKLPNPRVSSTFVQLVQEIAVEPHGIAFVGYSRDLAGTVPLKTLTVEGVLPADESIKTGEYPLLYPLLLYSDARIIQQKPQVNAFLKFYLTHAPGIVEQLGHFPASPPMHDNSLTTLTEAQEHIEADLKD